MNADDRTSAEDYGRQLLTTLRQAAAGGYGIQIPHDGCAALLKMIDGMANTNYASNVVQFRPRPGVLAQAIE